MKNSIKIITILGIATSFFPAHPMMTPKYPLLKKKDLKTVNPLSDMSDLKISYYCDGPKISENDPLFADRGLPLSLAIIKFCEEPDTAKNKQTLKAIYDAVSQGTPVTSKHHIQQNLEKKLITIYPSQESIPIRKLVENWSKDKLLKKILLKATISLGEREQQERLACKLKSESRKNSMSEILSFLPESNVDEERIVLIEQAEQKFREEQQS